MQAHYYKARKFVEIEASNGNDFLCSMRQKNGEKEDKLQCEVEAVNKETLCISRYQQKVEGINWGEKEYLEYLREFCEVAP